MMKLGKMHYFGVGLGLTMVAVSIFLFKKELLYFMLVVSLIAGSLPFLISLLLSQNTQREKEEKFLAFSRDLVESVKSGTPISKSIIQLRTRNYGSLTKHIVKMANQLTLGFTLNQALENFAPDFFAILSTLFAIDL